MTSPPLVTTDDRFHIAGDQPPKLVACLIGIALEALARAFLVANFACFYRFLKAIRQFRRKDVRSSR